MRGRFILLTMTVLRDLPPVVVPKPSLPDEAGYSGVLRDFAFRFCDPQSSGFFDAWVTISGSDRPLNFVNRPFCEIEKYFVHGSDTRFSQPSFLVRNYLRLHRLSGAKFSRKT